MKKFFMTAILAMFALAGFSQARWDARVGVNFSNLTKVKETKALPGFTLGLGRIMVSMKAGLSSRA